jgi:two-component system, chemotaxis family, CheB/CheR fusion protein
VLSGTASDGAEGLREIAAAGGTVLVQDPDEARYDGMPRAAIAQTGARPLPVAGIARELQRIDRKPASRPAAGGVQDRR